MLPHLSVANELMVLWFLVTIFEQFALSVPAVYELCKAVSRTVHGLEPEHFSLLYYLFDLSAAGGLEPVISNQKGGGQEAKVKVRGL